MSSRRFLVVTLHAAGNWPPEIALIRALAGRGLDVRVVSHERHAAQIRDAGGEYRPYRYAPQRDPTTRYDSDAGPEIDRIIRDVYLNRVYADELAAAVDAERPDVLLVDQMLMMAHVEAEATGLPTAILWHTVYGRASSLRQSADRFAGPINAFRAERGLEPVADPREAVERADAVFAFTYEAFDLVPDDLPGHVHYVGPLGCLPRASQSVRLPWGPDDRRPLVLVAYSTSFQDQVGVLQRLLGALEALPVRALVTLGDAISPAELNVPANAVAERFVDHAAVLPSTDLVVTHAGHGTVMAATTAGVPMVCTPMGRDQHTVAECVRRRGLGVVVSDSAPAAELREVVAAALADDALRERARDFALGLDVEAGLAKAIGVLEGLPR